MSHFIDVVLLNEVGCGQLTISDCSIRSVIDSIFKSLYQASNVLMEIHL
ncbi:hypothetical protein [Paenibacillus sp. FSL H7-0331]|nr:hypothetical protein [Paenibacillus sp. FSL H7-0331]